MNPLFDQLKKEQDEERAEQSQASSQVQATQAQSSQEEAAELFSSDEQIQAKILALRAVFSALKYYTVEFSDSRGTSKRNFKEELQRGKDALDQLKECLRLEFDYDADDDSEEEQAKEVEASHSPPKTVEIIDVTNEKEEEDGDDDYSA